MPNPLKKVYAALIISDEPIDLGSLIGNPAVNHLINEELEVQSTGQGGWVIEKDIPDQCHKGLNELFIGHGTVVSTAITGWFRAVCASVSYLPLYRKRKKQDQEAEQTDDEGSE